MSSCLMYVFFNDTATTEIYTYCHTLSLHVALPILARGIDRIEIERHEPRPDRRRPPQPIEHRVDALFARDDLVELLPVLGARAAGDDVRPIRRPRAAPGAAIGRASCRAQRCQSV